MGSVDSQSDIYNVRLDDKKGRGLFNPGFDSNEESMLLYFFHAVPHKS